MIVPYSASCAWKLASDRNAASSSFRNHLKLAKQEIKDLIEHVRRVAQGGGDPAASLIQVNECGPLDTIVALPADREGGIGFFDVDRFGVAITGKPRSELIGRVEQPGVAGFGGEQDKLTDGNDAPVV